MLFQKHASAMLLFEEAEKQGLKPVWLTQDGLFMVGDRYVYYTKLHMNSQLGAWICEDKSLTRAVLEKERLANIPFCYSKLPADVNRFFDVHHPVIQKPVLGMKSTDVRLVADRKDLQLTSLSDIITERYIQGTEYRCLVLSGSVIGMQRKTLDPSPEYPWRKHIAVLEKGEWDVELVETALAIAAKLQMRFLAVDFIVDTAGKAWILELNAMPGLYSFHQPDEGRPQNVAAKVLEAILV